MSGIKCMMRKYGGQPKIIKEIHTAYIEAGADIFETNTFNANGISQVDYDLMPLVYDMNLASAKIAVEARAEFIARNPGKTVFVAGALGPANRAASLSPDVNRPGYRNVTFDEIREGYYQQVRGLVEGGVDLLMVETIFDTLNSKAALFAIAAVFCIAG